jgi:hypothetical protein
LADWRRDVAHDQRLNRVGLFAVSLDQAGRDRDLRHAAGLASSSELKVLE